MKFQQLTIHNIASIEDATIDFEAQPLADSEVFLITGKTGAGKTSILDAICLALYADTPRLQNTHMQGDSCDGDKVKVNDTRLLMRRNTAEAFARLTFTGSNGIHYQATWSVARAYKKVTGSYQRKAWLLTNLDTGVTLNRDNEIKSEIRSAVGLDFNQFCRTTMLAQGEFTRFLNSKDDEKAGILEKITGVDIYSRVGAKIYELTGLKKLEWAEAKRMVEGTITLTDEQIAEKQQQINQLDEQYNKLKETSDKDCAKRNWLNIANELTRNRDDAAEALRQAQQAINSEEFRQKAQITQEWSATIDARQWMAEAKNAEGALMQSNKELEKLAGTYAGLLSGQRYAQNEVRQIEEEIRKIDDYLSAEADKASVYENAQGIEGLLTIIDNGRRTVRENLLAIEAENQKLAGELIPAFDSATSKAQEAKAAFELVAAEVKTLEGTVSALDLPDKRARRDNAKDLLNKIRLAHERIISLDEARKQYEQKRNKLAERKDSLDARSAASAEMEALVNKARIKMEVRHEDMNKQQDTIDKFAANLRLRLQVGDICPVCCQQITAALPHEDVLNQLVVELKQACNEAEAEYQKLFNQKVKLDAEIETESKAYERDINSFSNDTSVADAAARVAQACRDCGIEEYDQHTPARLDELESTTRTAYSNLDATISEGEKQEKTLSSRRNVLEAKRQAMNDSAAKVANADRAVSKCQGRIDTAKALVESKNAEVAAAEQKVSELITGTWPISWNQSPAEFAQALATAARTYNDKLQSRQQLDRQHDASQTNVRNVQSVFAIITSALPRWKDMEPTGASRVDNLFAQANALSSSLATILTQVQTAEQSLHNYREKLHTFLAAHTGITPERLEALAQYTPQDIAIQNQSLDTVRNNVVVTNTLHTEAQKQLAEHQQKKPQLADDDTLDTLQQRITDYEGQLQEIGEKKGSIRQELHADSENKQKLGTLIQEAERKEALYHKWARLNQLIGDATGSTFRRIAQSYVLTSLIHSANSYMRTLTDRYTLRVTPGTFVIMLEDAYQGYTTRAASTISGGESFLVSLSLALALSDIGQQWQVDTLFIDEGFGTLSGQPLQRAISTLRSLHSRAGRHVGIISHVEELQERIPVQIQVNQEGKNSSSIVTIVPRLQEN